MAPGRVSTTADGWMADNRKVSFLGMTAHWIEVKKINGHCVLRLLGSKRFWGIIVGGILHWTL